MLASELLDEEAAQAVLTVKHNREVACEEAREAPVALDKYTYCCVSCCYRVFSALTTYHIHSLTR